jgi:ribulose-phosphate 3-epimerase
MDGHFVPNITIGPAVVKSLKRVATVPLDVHLMITDPDRNIDAFADAGAAMISVHVEVLPHLHRTVHALKALNVKAGVVLNPSTPIVAIEEIASDVDFVLVMSVNPGFGGQKFIPASLEKIQQCRALAAGRPIDIEVDGGVTPETVPEIVKAGANVLVAGSAVFKGGNPGAYRQNISAIRNAAAAARGEAA